MITLQGMRLSQKGYTLYLTSTTVEDLRNWFNADRICADIWKREKPEGYQRVPDAARAKRIADYVEGKLHIEETLLPSSVILNVRQKGVTEFKAFKEAQGKETIEVGTISIYDEAFPFYEVDGQHRVRGLVEAYNQLKGKSPEQFRVIRSYPIPLTIIEGLDRATEAIQFAVINTTQRKVDPALVLRILHKRYRDKSEKLEFFLKGRTWRLYAVQLCDELNSDPKSPWCDKIIAPGDDRRGRVISEQNFVSSFQMIYPRLEPDIDIVKNYLPLYWKAIAAVWPECTGDNASRYSLQRTNGTNAFHWMFPYIYFKSVSLGNPKLKDFVQNLTPIRKKYNPHFWERGGEAKVYTSLSAQKNLADKMIEATLPRGSGFKPGRLPKGLEGKKEARTWYAAEKLIPLRAYFLFTQEKVDGIDAGATGVYALYSFSTQRYYVGRSEKADLRSRLQRHLRNNVNEAHIFNYRLCTEPGEAHDFECALFDLLPKNLLINKEHPGAFVGRECPFCAAARQ